MVGKPKHVGGPRPKIDRSGGLEGCSGGTTDQSPGPDHEKALILLLCSFSPKAAYFTLNSAFSNHHVVVQAGVS